MNFLYFIGRSTLRIEEKGFKFAKVHSINSFYIQSGYLPMILAISSNSLE